MRSTGANVCAMGGGLAGRLLRLLLAKHGVEVIALEAHESFDRDFRLAVRTVQVHGRAPGPGVALGPRRVVHDPGFRGGLMQGPSIRLGVVQPVRVIDAQPVEDAVGRPSQLGRHHQPTGWMPCAVSRRPEPVPHDRP
jgi:hypothetical protein